MEWRGHKHAGEHKVPNVKVFAFADDVALILEDVGRALGVLQCI
jgi:hypothetical protein